MPSKAPPHGDLTNLDRLNVNMDTTCSRVTLKKDVMRPKMRPSKDPTCEFGHSFRSIPQWCTNEQRSLTDQTPPNHGLLPWRFSPSAGGRDKQLSVMLMEADVHACYSSPKRQNDQRKKKRMMDPKEVEVATYRILTISLVYFSIKQLIIDECA